jgi:hypothetical protein
MLKFGMLTIKAVVVIPWNQLTQINGGEFISGDRTLDSHLV